MISKSDLEFMLGTEAPNGLNVISGGKKGMAELAAMGYPNGERSLVKRERQIRVATNQGKLPKKWKMPKAKPPLLLKPEWRVAA